MAAYQRRCLSRLLKGVVEAEGAQTSLSPRSRMFVSRVNKSFLMKIIAVWACLRARLSPSHSPRFLRQAEANDRLKSEVKRLKEAEDEKEKDVMRFKVTKRAPNAPEYKQKSAFCF